MEKHANTQSLVTPKAAHEFLLVSIEKHWKKYRVELKHLQNELSDETVHDLRTATRRMLTLVRLLRTLKPRPKHLRKLRRTFKDQLDSLDELRDTQVMLDEISKTVAEISTLQPFQEYLQKKEQRLFHSVKKKSKQIKPGDAAKPMLKNGKIPGIRKFENIPARMLQVADDAFLTTQQRLGLVNPSDSASIHRVRLAFKKFRYLVEIIHPVLRNFPQANLERMDDYQNALGKIQDTEVLLRSMADFASSESTFDAKAALRFYEQRRADAISAYFDRRHELNTFWRAVPDQPFPWEEVP